MNESSSVRDSKSDPQAAPARTAKELHDRFWVARPLEGAGPEGAYLWWACPDCLGRLPRRSCTTCEGTGQYAGQARPTYRQKLNPEDAQAGLQWLRALRGQ